MPFGAASDSATIFLDGTPPPEVEEAITDHVPSARPISRARLLLPCGVSVVLAFSAGRRPSSMNRSSA
ncbi:MAG: hypothetical protein HYX51_06890 [Chloroflexi bacterium]|nr:hypothetical protein [Chloroflexota bacterium]